ncbi:MAG: hypothetical protein PHH30_08145 [Bacteroidales bacterium]|nr:hypothetical protein [Bacteroidales bacterium]
MKNIVVIVSFIGLFVFSSSCKKQKMPEGEYSFTFENTEGVIMEPITLLYTVVESTRDYIVLNNSYQDTLFKDGKNITGTITYHGAIPGEGLAIYFSPFQITGIYDKNKGVYFISGTFKSKIITPRENPWRMDTLDTSGTFEFKQFFME